MAIEYGNAPGTVSLVAPEVDGIDIEGIRPNGGLNVGGGKDTPGVWGDDTIERLLLPSEGEEADTEDEL